MVSCETKLMKTPVLLFSLLLVASTQLSAQTTTKEELYFFKHKFSRNFIYGDYERVTFTLERHYDTEAPTQVEYFVKMDASLLIVEPGEDDALIGYVDRQRRDLYLFPDEVRQLIDFLEEAETMLSEPFEYAYTRERRIADDLALSLRRKKPNRIHLRFQLFDLIFYDNLNSVRSLRTKLLFLLRKVDSIDGSE